MLENADPHTVAKAARLARILADERPELAGVSIPEDGAAIWFALRALMNTRPPSPLPASVLALQDSLLQSIRESRGITDVHDIGSIAGSDRIALWQGDITTLRADAIVNAANPKMLGCFAPNHRCIDNAIHTFAGMQLRLACDEIMISRKRDEPTGTATVTPAFNLPAEYVLHTVGPTIAEKATDRHDRELASCYESCLKAAAECGASTIAFCCISTGEFRFPRERAARIAVGTVRKFLVKSDSIETVVFDVYTAADRAIYERELSA